MPEDRHSCLSTVDADFRTALGYAQLPDDPAHVASHQSNLTPYAANSGSQEIRVRSSAKA
jgi:hypothetical protein